MTNTLQSLAIFCIQVTLNFGFFRKGAMLFTVIRNYVEEEIC